MNFDIGGPSNFSSSSSSFEDEDEQLLEENESAQNAIIAQHSNIQRAMSQYFNQQHNPVTYGGSIHDHRVINRDRESADRRLFYDYFAESPRYNDQMFRRRFRMRRSLFLRIVEKVEARDNYFVQRRDNVGRLGLSALQKITATFRMLAYGLLADATDEYIKIGESTTIESLKRFCRAVVEEFKDEYLRSPNATDVARLLCIGKDRGFP